MNLYSIRWNGVEVWTVELPEARWQETLIDKVKAVIPRSHHNFVMVLIEKRVPKVWRTGE